MEIRTLDDVQAWVDRMRRLGREDGPYDPQELRQVLLVHQREIMALQRCQATHSQHLARHDAELEAIKADHDRLNAALAAGDDLDVFEAGYEKGYRLGWTQARQHGQVERLKSAAMDAMRYAIMDEIEAQIARLGAAGEADPTPRQVCLALLAEIGRMEEPEDWELDDDDREGDDAAAEAPDE